MTWDEQYAKTKKRLDDEYAWFDANRASIIEGHHGEKAALRDHRVWGYFPDTPSADAFMRAKGIEEGEYAIQVCVTAQEESDLYHSTYMDVRPVYA
jgi:hypothetical protein